MRSKGPPNPMSREGERSIAIGGSAIGNAFGLGSSVINIGGDNYGQVGQTLTNCTNMIQKESSNDRRTLLKALHLSVRELIENLPPDKEADGVQIAKDFEMLVEQATSEKPNRRWVTVSAEGLLEAAGWVGDFASKIGDSILNVGKAIWPDFKLPGA